MKKVMKAAMVAALVMVSAAASAQTGLSVNAGYVSTKSTEKDSKAMNGITAGIGYDMSIQGGFGLALGLNYTYGFFNEKETISTPLFGNYTIEGKTADHTLDVPVRLTYTYPISDNFKVFGFAGPKFAYAIAGKTKVSFDGNEAIKETLEASGVLNDGDMYGEKGIMNQFDIKLGLGAGVNFNNILLKVGYDWGLLDQLKKSENETDHQAVRINQFYVTVGYAF
jgi:opacity protein-like surface antigen